MFAQLPIPESIATKEPVLYIVLMALGGLMIYFLRHLQKEAQANREERASNEKARKEQSEYFVGVSREMAAECHGVQREGMAVMKEATKAITINSELIRKQQHRDEKRDEKRDAKEG